MKESQPYTCELFIIHFLSSVAHSHFDNVLQGICSLSMDPYVKFIFQRCHLV